MDFTEKFELHECPICGGAGLMEEEDHGYYVACLDCGSYTGTVGYKTEEGREQAAERSAMLWNTGKVINSAPGE
ncbi:Restriction alleviation protein Lar [Pseudobutyrivibrio sp. 49]|uniref:Lar family restriction alleviation protein n=1 Tax=Pseudobutyrivibrio sp. 49 TaxID=1855344 RepID=UPI00087F3DD4|nr:Lar family restriction alleviation protein [Pseudobutyrivibrio sp. 49]SDI38453.1 Restriction alleviation protein Lar [Pseudobutyrivibrio sp. 49]